MSEKNHGRRAYSREEMIEEAKAYMRETWGRAASRKTETAGTSASGSASLTPESAP